ncbi:unnamed protein product [Miscanthus lutarioriparius]|uniref:Uncharacterized protein n=1 Tax=Miscanthus lutarioriparius TaxID=422564 RepID=A0A811MUM7_9POAL|nr:unnamed protein product [Miscanthus lutarioriparius]
MARRRCAVLPARLRVRHNKRRGARPQPPALCRAPGVVDEATCSRVSLLPRLPAHEELARLHLPPLRICALELAHLPKPSNQSQLLPAAAASPPHAGIVRALRNPSF